MELNKIHNIDCLAGLKLLADKSVHCVVTSPPYFALRDYGTAVWTGGKTDCDHKPSETPEKRGIKKSTLTGGKKSTGHQQEGFKEKCGKCGAIRIDQQVGLEKTPHLFVARLVEIFREVKRVLRDDGTVWLNIGDSYAGNMKTRKEEHFKKSTLASKQYQYSDPIKKLSSGLKSKDLIGIPWMLAFALRDDGWYLRQDLIWHKTTSMPESVTDRCTKNHEYIFLLTKKPKYYYDHVAIMKDLADSTANDARLYDENYEATRPNRGGVNDRPDRGNGLLKPKASETFKRENSKRGIAIPGQQKGTHRPDMEDTFSNGKANKRSVWTVTPKAFAEAHFATYPQELIIDCIKAGTSEYGYCLNCGMPYKRYNKKSLVPTKKASFNSKADDRDFNADLQDAGSNRAKDGHKPGWINTYETLGWVPSCKCANTERGPGTILDPFMGAGTTALVAQKLGRNFIGFELNPKYVAMANKRLNSHLGMFSPENIKRIQQQPTNQLTIDR